MITYASYVRRREDMVGSGLVVGLLELRLRAARRHRRVRRPGLHGPGPGVAVGEVASGGIGLAFIAFPTIISEAPAGPSSASCSSGSLVVAGITSLVSVIEVVISAVRDKFDTSRLTATLAVGVPAALLSLVLFSTTSGIYVLDVVDHFVNQYGILVAALVSMLVVAWGVRALSGLSEHLNVHGRPRVGAGWRLLTSVVAPAALALVLVLALRDDLREAYEGYPTWLLLFCGWLLVVALPGIGALLARLPWRAGTHLAGPPPGADPAAPLHATASTDSTSGHRRTPGNDEGGLR
jgi:NSS family neurotransmitter:Na+ symporter